MARDTPRPPAHRAPALRPRRRGCVQLGFYPPVDGGTDGCGLLLQMWQPPCGQQWAPLSLTPLSGRIGPAWSPYDRRPLSGRHPLSSSGHHNKRGGHDGTKVCTGMQCSIDAKLYTPNEWCHWPCPPLVDLHSLHTVHIHIQWAGERLITRQVCDHESS